MFNGSALMDFHRKWGHLNFAECCKELGMNQEKAKGIICEECELAKIRKKKIPRGTVTRSDQPIYRVHVDLSGRKLSSLEGYRYYLLITDDYSRFRWVRLLRQKSDAVEELKSFVNEVEREKAPLKVAVIRSDCGGEFYNHTLDTYFSKLGIKRERSVPYSQFQNGVAERSIGVVDDCSRTMMLYAGSPVYDWCHAVEHAVYVKNRVPSKAIGGCVPIELYSGVLRELRKNMPVFGCLGYAKVNVRGKQDNKGRRVVFLCAGDEVKGDRVRDITSFHSSLNEYESRDVTYDIRQYPYRSRLVPRPPVKPMDEEDIREQLLIQKKLKESAEAGEVKTHDAEVKEDGSEGWEVERVIDKRPSRFGPRGRAPELRGFDYKVVWRPEGMYSDSWEPEANLRDCGDAIAAYELASERASEPEVGSERASVRRSVRLREASGAHLVQGRVLSLYTADPVSRAEAMASEHREEWLAAEQDELKSIAEHGVWTLVDPVPGMNVLGCKFVYKLKRHPDGTVDKFKVRLVAQGFKQKQGVDYQEIFATTAALQAIRMVLWIAVFYKFEIWKLDIKTFFLYGELEEQIFMKQPPGYEQGNKVCALVKTLYGLKQSMRRALMALTKQLALRGVLPLKTDQNIFYRRNEMGIVILSAWVDDVLLYASSHAVASDVVALLEQKFIVSVDRDPRDYLQLQLVRDKERRQCKVYQTGYVTQLSKNYQVGEGDGLKIPFTTTNDLVPVKEMQKDDDVAYMELVGSLIWVLKTRPDVSLYISMLSRYMKCYDKQVYKKALRVLRYLYATKDMGLVYDESQSVEYEYGQGVQLEFEVDSDFGGRLELGGKSTTGWICKANNSVVYSGCVIQKRVATSTTEAESNGLEIVCKEAQWYRDFLNELEIDVSYAFPVSQDNKGALTLTEDPKNRPRTKYFRISQAYIRSQRILGKLKFVKKDGKLLTCDMLNKLLYYPEFSRHRSCLLGDQTVLKKNNTGKEWSSDEIGDGPARTKRVSRRTPLEIRRAKKKLRQKLRSLSHHNPPLYCVCPQCFRFLKWKPRANDWEDCDCFLPYCVQCRRCKCVTCYECDSDCEFNVALDMFWCPHCVEVNSRGSRKRKRPSRYEP